MIWRRPTPNIRAGYVYVISNFGSFGEHVVKIGLTRRLEPMDPVRELGDASVPFNFDVHAMVFSDDAVSLEGNLHQAFTDRRVNLVNQRREFFYATPTEVREALETLGGQQLLEFHEVPEAADWRASGGPRRLRVGDEATSSGFSGLRLIKTSAGAPSRRLVTREVRSLPPRRCGRVAGQRRSRAPQSVLPKSRVHYHGAATRLTGFEGSGHELRHAPLPHL